MHGVKSWTIAGFIIVAFVTATPATEAARWQSEAPYRNEAEAVAAGLELGIGEAVLEGPPAVPALSTNHWTLVYTAGRAGIPPGGGIRICMRHVHMWSPPQDQDPKAPGYTTIAVDGRLPVDVVFDFEQRRGQLVWDYFPWQHMIEVRMRENSLLPGQSIRVTLGDTRQGSPGIRVQPFDETAFMFKVFVDARGRGCYLPLAKSPTLRIVAAEPKRLGAVMPSEATVGEPTWCIVRAEDGYGNPAGSYTGTVRVRCESDAAVVPVPYHYGASDAGVHRFEDIVFNQPGVYTLTATDGEMERVSNPIRVTAAPGERKLLWGDLHGHTLFSDGRGTVEEFYDFAENVAGLDFCTVTDHGFEMTEGMWEHSKKVTNAVNTPGRFVTFPAYEWSGKTEVGGDHNVYFLDPDPPLYRSRSYYSYRNLQMYHGPEPQVNHVEDIFAVLTPCLEERNVFVIPHYGGRKGNPAFHNPRIQRMIEVFSEHRRSEDWMTPFLKRGYRLGIIASTDGHYGNPGYGYLKPTFDWTTQEIGMAAVAVYAEAHTRPGIFHSLYDRHVYATSGDRIILDVRADGHLMGSEYPSTRAPVLSVLAIGTAPITTVEIKKNSDVVYTTQPDATRVQFEWQDPAFRAEETCYYYVRVVQANKEEAIASPIWVN
jgi:hypothetical protein